MGAGVASAMAAKLVHPDAQVVAVCGDGGFMMSGANELGTLLEQRLDIVICVLNDNAYGMIKWKQAGAKLPAYGLDLGNPDFAAYAEAFGARGHRVRSAAELQPTLDAALAAGGVHVIDIPISYEAYGEYLNFSLREEVDAYRAELGCKPILSDAHREELKELGQSAADVATKTVASSDSAKDEQEEEKTEAPKESASKTKKKKKKVKGKGEEVDNRGGGGDDGDNRDAKNAASTTKEKFELKKEWPYYLANKAVYANTKLKVDDKASLQEVAAVAVASEEVIQEAIDAAVAAEKPMAALAAYERKAILVHIVDELKRRREHLAQVLCVEAGKPIKDARGEVGRAIATFELAAEETTRIYGEWERYRK